MKPGQIMYSLTEAERFDDPKHGIYFAVANPVETMDFKELIGAEVLINRAVWRVKAVDRFMHMPPWRKGERIGLRVDLVAEEEKGAEV